ncbi:PLD nuclease N-terminal domain-containing protein [Floricoccus penangensis]
MTMQQIHDLLPFLIPLVIVEFALLIYTLVDIFKHDHYKHGTRAMWFIVTIVGMNFVGPILYFLLGREES